MAPHKGWVMDREAVAERRALVMDLHARGRYAWQIAYDLKMSIRTVQRHLAAVRIGRDPGKQISQEVASRLPVVAKMLNDGAWPSQIGRELGISAGAVRHYIRRWPDLIRQHQR